MCDAKDRHVGACDVIAERGGAAWQPLLFPRPPELLQTHTLHN